MSSDSVGQSADLRTRIAAVQRAHRLVTRMVGRKAEKSCLCGWRSPERDCTFTDHPEHVADAVIRELGRRTCQRCRLSVPLDGFPPPHEGSDVMRPYCWGCTNYIEWATS